MQAHGKRDRHRRLTHFYGKRIIYDDLNLTLQAGKIYGLPGKNGVGKTTPIKILIDFLRPASGRCRVFDEDSHNLSPATRARIGLLFEGHVLLCDNDARQQSRCWSSLPTFPLDPFACY